MVTRIHGKYTKVLMTTTHTGGFSVLGSVSEVTLNRDPDRVDATSFGDGNKVSLQGFPSAEITMRGFYDLDDTVLKAARLVTNGVMVGIYPNYDADKTTFYAVMSDVEFSYSSGVTAAQTLTVTANARETAIDNL